MAGFDSIKWGGDMRFLRGRGATISVEWIVVAALLVLILVPTLISLFESLRVKFQAINNGL
jgi:Flp pilus assembly pilin Flp